jgi:uncharacterized protein with HEPN domain
MRVDRLRLGDIQTSIAKIREKVSVGEEAFYKDEMLQVWVVHHLQIIGEALASLSPELRDANASWARPIIATRNILVHHYFVVKLEVIWDIVENHLDDLEARVKGLLESLPEG